MSGPSDTGAVVRGWWDYERLSQGSREERKALELGLPESACMARQVVDEAVDLGGPAAVELLAAIIDAAPADRDGTAVGVGPLEDLLHEHGDELIDVIESYARQRPAFAYALAAVWIERGHLAADTEARLSRWIARFTTNP